MKQLEERLQADLGAAADAAPVADPRLEDVMASVRQSEKRRRIRYVVAVAAIVAPLAAIGFNQLSGIVDDSSSTVGTAPDKTTTLPDPTTTLPDPTTSTTDGTTSSTTTVPAVSDVVLRGDGLGVVRFRQPADEVFPALVARFGEPTDDSTHPADQCTGGVCLPVCAATDTTMVRRVGWRDDGLTVDFVGPSADRLQFVRWGVVQGATLETAEGLSLDDPLDTWRRAYGDSMSLIQGSTPGSPNQSYRLEIDTRRGQLEGSTESGNPPTSIVWVSGGTNCETGGD